MVLAKLYFQKNETRSISVTLCKNQPKDLNLKLQNPKLLEENTGNAGEIIDVDWNFLKRNAAAQE